MKAYFETNKENKFRAIVVIPLKRGGEYRVMARVSGTEKSGKRVEFSFPSMWLWKADVHTFGKACAMLANWAGKQTGKKYKAGGGGHKEEINDGQIRLWNWDTDYYLYVEENMIVIIGDTKIPPDKFSTLWALAGRAAQIRYELVMREQWWEQNSEAFLAQYQRE